MIQQTQSHSAAHSISHAATNTPKNIPINTATNATPHTTIQTRAVRFGIIGVGGYIAPRHLRAMKEIGAELVCAFDVRDCVGVLDSYFPDAEFFTSEDEFVEYVQSIGEQGKPLEYISICSPNFLHFHHIALSLQLGISAICEKPLVLHTSDMQKLIELESSAHINPHNAKAPKVYGILQLRLHTRIQALRQMIAQERGAHNLSSQSPQGISRDRFYDLSLRYISARGKWYMKSWKADTQKSGGIICNIGVHLFDMLLFVFGKCERSELESISLKRASGTLYFANARVKWLLSIDASDMAGVESRALRVLESTQSQRSTHPVRSTQYKRVDSNMDSSDKIYVDFSQGFDDLHTMSYAKILDGSGFGLSDIADSIKLIDSISKQGAST